jgi:penicillin-binding protein 2
LDEFARGSLDRSDYAATSLIGRSGIERSYETVLHGSVGYRQQVVNAQGRVLFDSTVSAGDVLRLEPLQGSIETRWPIPGDNVVLGLDIHLQSVAQRAMDGFRGAVVAIDPATGDVLAMVSAPAFDPNLFSVGLSSEDFRALNSDPDKPLFHRALAGNYPPGSTIKPFLGLAALHHESLEPERRDMCPGYFVLPGYSHRYRDWKSQGHGPVDLHQAIVESCDVYFYKLALGLGIDNISVFLRDIGFGVETGIDVSGENSGLVPTREWKQSQFSAREDQVWFPGETVITGIGQGFMLATPLQLAHATAMLATGGQRFQPRLVMAVENGTTGKVVESDPVRLNVMSNIDEPHWQEIEEAMVGVTEESQGTGRVAMRGTPYFVAGKTGTAQVFSLAQDQEYDEEAIDERLRDHGLFIAYAPSDNPAIAVAVVVENGGGGSTTAATVARKVLDAYLLGEGDVVQ